MYNAIVSYIRGQVPENIFLTLSHKASFSLDKNGDYEEEFHFLKMAFNAHVHNMYSSDYIVEGSLVYEALEKFLLEIFNDEAHKCSLYFAVTHTTHRFDNTRVYPKTYYYLFRYKDGMVTIYSDNLTRFVENFY